MRKWMCVFAIAAAWVLPCVTIMSQDGPERDLPKATVREVFVSSDEMATLLENCKDRVLLSREEFESLLIESLKQKEAEPDPTLTSPVASVFLSSDLAIVIEGEQAKIKAVLEWESLTDKLHAEPLDFDGAAIQSAMLNGQPARLGFALSPEMRNGDDAQKRYTLFWQGKGRQRLELELTVALTVDSVRQELAFAVPRAPKATETLVVPGDVELKSGAMVVNRRVEGEGPDRRTHFELLTADARQHLVLTLNSHRTRMIKSVLAKSVQFAEVTEHYEKLHATFSLDVLHQPVDAVEFVVPQSFEMTGVDSPQLARWELVERDGRSILAVRFREPVGGQVSLNLAAVRFYKTESTAETLAEWVFPNFTPLDVGADSAVFGLLLDAGWNAHKIEAARLIAIAPQILNNTIPDSVFEANVDAPTVRTVAAWYAPNADDFRITCEFLKPKPVFDVVSHQVLTLSDREQTLRGLLQVAPRYEKLFELKLDVPADWTVTRVTNEADAMLPFEQKDGRVRVKVPNGIAAGTIFPVFFEASGNTPGWFGVWEKQELPFPCFRLVDATGDRGTIAVDVDEDMIVTSENDVRLVPLDGKERTEFLAGVPTDLAFRYMSRPYSTDLRIMRAEPRSTAKTFAFFAFAPSLMSARYELHYTVEQAKAKSLAFLLPVETPDNIAIRGLNVAVKDYVASTVTVDGKQYRKWDVQLADPRMGSLTLAVDFEQATPEEMTQSLPMATACDVAWQTGLISVEGHEELNLALAEHATMRQVDVGELAATRYVPGKRLLGVFEGVTDVNALKIDIARNPDFQLPASLVQFARADVEIAVDGKRVTRAIYDLKTRATFLKIDLAGNEEIWAVSLDGKTIKPQKSGNAVMVDIPARDDAAVRELEIVWASQKSSRTGTIFVSSSVRLPDLMLPQNTEITNKSDDVKTQTTVAWKKIPVTRIAWNVTAPPGCEVTRIGNRRIETETPRPLVLQYWSKMFAPSEMPRERRSWGFGCSAAPKSAETSRALYMLSDASAPASADFAAVESSEKRMTYENQRSKTRSRQEETGADFGELSALSNETINADSWKNEEMEDAYDELEARGIHAQRGTPERESRRENFQMFLDQERASIPTTSEDQTGELRMSGGIASDSGLVGRFALEERNSAVPYQKQTLQTVRPVQVRFQQNLSASLQRHVQFQQVGGSESQLKVRMVDTRLVTFGIALVWGGVLCAGLCLLKTSRRVRAIYVLAVLSLGTLLVLVPRLEMFAGLFDEAVKAGFWVFVIYLLVGGYRMYKNYRTGVSTAVVALLALTVFSATARANDDSSKPISLPGDTVVAFYDAELMVFSEDGMPDPKTLSHPDQKLLVPYAKYVELWNLVHPGETVEPIEKPPVDYVMTFGEYRTALTSSNELSITGKLEIETTVDEPVLFPLPIAGGILTSLQVDGKNAEISIRPQPEQEISQQQTANVSPVHGGVFVLQLHGKGKHVIELTAKFKVDRQGGWRLASGRLPEFPVGKVWLELPEDRMELRCNDVYAQQKWQAETPGEIVEMSLGQDGRFNWSWRSKVTEAEVDRSLTAESELRFNIQEDSLVLEWDLTLAFRRGKYESFRARIPSDYLVVSIAGENVRGWENVESDSPDESSIDVELLHAAQEIERFQIVLMRKADFDKAKNVPVTVPNVAVVGAAMHHGRITLQNSPRFDVKTGELVNVSMTDLPETQGNNPDSQNSMTENPLGLKTYRAYRFTAENYRLPMTVSIDQAKTPCRLRNIVKLAIHEIKLESKFYLYLHHQREDRFCQRLILPVGLHLDAVHSNLSVEWSTKPLESGETELAVFWSTIPEFRQIEFNILGTIEREPDDEIHLPIVLPQNVDVMNQETAILTDPDFDVEVSDFVNCFLYDKPIVDWISESQRSLHREWIYIQGIWNNNKKPSAKLSLIPREPVITSESITNVQVGSRSVEEMILLDFNIQNAGIRSVRFELPQSMADAKIDAPLLQRKEITPDENGDSVMVTLHLQDEIMNEFRVLIRNNHELVSDKPYAAAIPKIRTGTTLNQFVVLENAGSFDELQVDAAKISGMRKISRQNREWANLAAILGGNATEAWLVTDDANPRLSFRMVRRETVKMSGARIGLAETRVVLGENGDYLAEQIYRIDNKTEQFLDLKLPPGAELWAVRLLTNREWEARQSGAAGDFGQPVKPTTLPKSDTSGKSTTIVSGVRIPIIKTEVGDLDYVVRIVYAGKCDPIRWATKLDIPFLEVLNIPVGASYARLHLPENYKYKFDGTMTASDQGGITKIHSEYEKQVDTKLQQAVQTGNPYEQARAMSNLSLKKGVMPSSTRSYTVHQPVYETRDRSYQTTRPGYAMQTNSAQLAQRFESQSNSRSQNVVLQSESNWKAEAGNSSAGALPDVSGQQFNTEWLGKNYLDNPQSGGKLANDAKTSGSSVMERLSEYQSRASDIPLAISEKSEREPSRPRVADANPMQQAPMQSLAGQERLNDSGMASKLAGNRPQMESQQISQEMWGQIVNQRDIPQSNAPQSPATVNNVELYQQRLAVQNADIPAQQRPMASSASASPQRSGGMSGQSAYGVNGAMGKATGMEETPPLVYANPTDMSSGGGYGGMSGGSGFVGSSGGMEFARSSRPTPASTPARGGARAGRPGVSVEQNAIGVVKPSFVAANEPFGSAVASENLIQGLESEMSGQASLHERMATKTASLDIEIPQTGTVYFFTAPQAENRLSVSGVSNAGSQRMKDFARVAGMLAVCAMVGFLVLRKKRTVI